MTWYMAANEQQTRQPDAVIVLDTNQHTYRFIEKLGFVVEKITPNGYAEGLVRYDLVIQ